MTDTPATLTAKARLRAAQDAEVEARIEKCFYSLLDDMHEPRAIVRAATYKLFNFIADEAGGLTPQAIEEVKEQLDGCLEQAMRFGND